eukprot:3671812-Rhodomonas_salina.4
MVLPDTTECVGCETRECDPGMLPYLPTRLLRDVQYWPRILCDTYACSTVSATDMAYAAPGYWHSLRSNGTDGNRRFNGGICDAQY